MVNPPPALSEQVARESTCGGQGEAFEGGIDLLIHVEGIQ
jgi:hypothetical protein